jgi:hypothetical protein
LFACAFAVSPASAQQGRTPFYDDAKARFCPRAGVSNGPAIFIGRVLDAETDAPIAAASVSMVYTDSTADILTDRVRRVRTSDDGSFGICGLPERYAGTVQATHGALSTAEVPIAANNELLSAMMLSLNVSGSATAVLRGHVTVKGGTPVPGAQVAVQGATSISITSADGVFVLNDLPSGTQAAVVRKIGFAPVTIGVNLSTRKPAELTVVLSEAQILAAVHIVGKMDDALQKVGFATRQKSSLGHFIGPDEIERRRPLMFTDLLQAAAGFRVTNVGTGRLLQSTRATSGTSDGCVNIFVDRTPFEQVQPGDLDSAFRPGDIGAIELYSSPNDVPAEFHMGGRACATVAVWTKTRLSLP